MSCFKKKRVKKTGLENIYLNEYDESKHTLDSGRKTREDTRQKESVKKEYPDNVTSTAKYTKLSFIPLSLFYHFSKYTNLYFLVMTILLVTELSPFSLSSVISPIVFITLVSMLREGIEDYARHKSDK